MWKNIKIQSCSTPAKVSAKLCQLGLGKLAQLCEEHCLSGELVADVLDNLPAEIFLTQKYRTQRSMVTDPEPIILSQSVSPQNNHFGTSFRKRSLVVDLSSSALNVDSHLPSPVTASFVSKSHPLQHPCTPSHCSHLHVDPFPKTPPAVSEGRIESGPNLCDLAQPEHTEPASSTQQRFADATRANIHRLYDFSGGSLAQDPVDGSHRNPSNAAHNRNAAIDYGMASAVTNHRATSNLGPCSIGGGRSRPAQAVFRLLPPDPGSAPASCAWLPPGPAAIPWSGAACADHRAAAHGWEEATHAPQKREVDPSILVVAAARPPRSPHRPVPGAGAGAAAGMGGGAGGAGAGASRVAVPKLWCSGHTPRRIPDSDDTDSLLSPQPALHKDRPAAAAGHGGGGRMWVVAGEAASSPASPALSHSSESATSSTADTLLTDRPLAEHDPLFLPPPAGKLAPAAAAGWTTT